MDQQHDFDRVHSHSTDGQDMSLKSILEQSKEREEEMMRTYLIAAERVHGDQELKTRLREFAEGNAKRSRQLINELEEM